MSTKADIVAISHDLVLAVKPFLDEAMAEITKLRADLSEARAERDAAAREAERLRAVLTGLAEDFESARDKATYAAEAQRLHKCAQEIRGLAVLATEGNSK